ncbi:MAG: toxic anion resistance protein [Ewingella americana]|nr:toxic anion resistance protein [Ewingella americana]MCI1679679.1 toxic anion resistance protein [Ewingella americana]MCI1855363.1 toxic anion resistance protein [Ewingella americana]MCI1863143.1 toxic anion resistance protein [Ewingella americana]MCI2140817.1 toxic anion resistance protein [Ewingella americana]MCI2165412.1 toxic anion resistance protein [Ewingella americana]
MTAEDQQQLDEIVAQIDITDPVLSIAYGAKTMNAMSRFSESMMQEVRAKDAGEIGQQLTTMLSKVKSIDLTVFEQKKGLLESLPLIGKMFSKLERTLMEYQTLAQQVDTISNKLQDTIVELLRNIATLEQLFIRNSEYFKQISLHIIAGKKKIEQIQTTDLPQAQAKAEQSGDAMDAQLVRDLVNGIQRFERRLHDLLLSRTFAIQTAPQIRLMQNNSQSLAEKIQSSILTTIPIWKSQIVLALSLNSQRQAAKLQKDVADTTNEMLRRNAEMLEMGSIETATEVERSIIDIDTLRDVQNRLLNTLEETLSIASNARQRRAEVEKELGGMEQELRTKLASIAAGQNAQAKVVG